MEDGSATDEAKQPDGMCIPIYLDEVERMMVDATAEDKTAGEWHPMNGAADRLIKCQDALKSISEVIETVSEVGDPVRKRRRLRHIFVPMHIFCEAIVDLINQAQSDKDVQRYLPKEAGVKLTQLKSFFIKRVPFARNGKLGILRNKVAAHSEKGMSQEQMRELYKATDSTEVGEWLHTGISVLCDLMKLQVFTWQAEGPAEDMVTVMYQEPMVSVLRFQDGETAEIEGIYVARESPRSIVMKTIIEATEISQKLFLRDCLFRIRGFVPDSKEDWARSLDYSIPDT